MKYAEILAGGSGKRFGDAELPKQFQILGTKPIIIHTIEQFMINPNIDKIIVVVPKDWMTYTEDLIKKYIPNFDQIEITNGGATRNESIMNGCNYIKEKYGIDKDDVVVTHDAVRPFINQRIIDDNLNALKKYDAVDTAISATDTIISINKNKEIDNVPDRSTLQYGQTPQSFNIKKLMELYNKLTKDEKDILTDACKIFVLKKKPVKVVEGDSYNIKITTVFDLKIANAIVQVRCDD